MYAVGLKRNCAWLLAAGTCADVDASTDVDATPYVDPRAKTHQYSHSSTSNPYSRTANRYARTANRYARTTNRYPRTANRYSRTGAPDSHSIRDYSRHPAMGRGRIEQGPAECFKIVGDPNG